MAAKHWWQNWNTKQKILAGASTFLALIVLGVIGYLVFGSQNSPLSVQKLTGPPPPPPPILSPLTGLKLDDEALAKRPVTAIMIENSTLARPQSGLSQAGIVFEAIAEAGITRFLALYQEAQPNYIGPVRSLRPYYIDWAKPFDAGIAHAGGSPVALQQIRKKGMKDLDYSNFGYFWRASHRASPHDLYTSFGKTTARGLDALNKAKGYKTSKFTSWERKDESPLEHTTVKQISLAISGPLYNVSYSYDKVTNTYPRRMAGSAHVSTKSKNDKGKRIAPKVVIALIMDHSIVDGEGHSGYKTTGTGRAYIFQDGGVTVGSWNKKDRNDQFRFTDAEGKIIKLNAGQTWVTVVDNKKMVKYKEIKPPAPAPSPTPGSN